MDLSGSRVLVTGGAGLVGSHIVDELVAKCVDEVVVLDNLIRGTRENLSFATKRGNVRLVVGDVRDVALLKKLCEGIDFIFHEAAIRITMCVDEPREALEVLIDGTFNVLEAAVEADVKKVVAASSASVYGTANEFPTRESHHLYNNRTLYGACKVASEQMLRAFYDMYGLDYVVLRYFNVYGPRMDIFGRYTEVMIRWLDCIDGNLSPVVFGDGEQSMDFTYVTDIARANILAMESDVTDHIFNVGTGVTTTLNELLDTLLKLSSSDLKCVYQPQRKAAHIQCRLASTEKAKDGLGFTAEVDLVTGLQQLIIWREAMLEIGMGVTDECTSC